MEVAITAKPRYYLLHMSEQLSCEQVEHIATLARLELSDSEITKYQGELTRILEYISELTKVDTTGVEETAQVTGQINRLRDDVALPSDAETRQRLLYAMPEREGDYLKVKAVFE